MLTPAPAPLPLQQGLEDPFLCVRDALLHPALAPAFRIPGSPTCWTGILLMARPGFSLIFRRDGNRITGRIVRDSTLIFPIHGS